MLKGTSNKIMNSIQLGMVRINFVVCNEYVYEYVKRCFTPKQKAYTQIIK